IMARIAVPLAVILTALLAGCEDPKPDFEKKKESAKIDKPAGHGSTYKIEKGPFKVEASCKGVFEAAEMTEVALNPDAWTPNNGGQLVVLKAVEHGTPVRKG